MGQDGSSPEFHVNFLVGSGHFSGGSDWVGSKKIGLKSNSGLTFAERLDNLFDKRR